jgi:hypothetical protein
LKNNKAAGPDNIPAEVIKADIGCILRQIFLNRIKKKVNNKLRPNQAGWSNSK